MQYIIAFHVLKKTTVGNIIKLHIASFREFKTKLVFMLFSKVNYFLS